MSETGRRGLVVAALDPKLLAEIYQFRSAIEPLAVRLAIPELTKALIDEGRDILRHGDELVAQRDTAALTQADMDFHYFIYRLSGNSLVIESMRLNWQHLRRSMGAVLRLPTLAQRVWREHRAIFDAMVAGQAERAELLIRDHLGLAYSDLLSSVPAEPRQN